MDILICWIGNADLSAAEKDDADNLGPIAQALKDGSYSQAVFLDNYRNERIETYRQWLASRFSVPFEICPIVLSLSLIHI